MKWPMVRLEEVATIVGGNTPLRSRQEFWDGDIPWVTPTDLPMPGQGIAEVTETTDKITREGLASCSAQLLPIDTVLFSSRATIGKLGISKVPSATNQGLANFIPKPWVDARFLAYSLQYHTPSIALLARKTTFKEVSKGALKHFRISLPPLSEQRRIVEILDQADSLRRKHAEANLKAERLLPSLFIKMFGDPVTNPKGWDVFELGDLCTKITSGLRDWAKYTGRGDALFVRTQDINDGEISGDLLAVDPPSGAEAERTRLCCGDVVVTITGMGGKAAVFRAQNQNVYVSQHVALVRPRSDLEPEYLAAFANFPAGSVPLLARFQYGQTKPGLGFRELRAARIPLPPIELQGRFVSQAQNIRTLKGYRSTVGAKLEELWAVLLHRAFSSDLTARWREAHMHELLAEMEQQTKWLAGENTRGSRETTRLQQSLFQDEISK